MVDIPLNNAVPEVYEDADAIAAINNDTDHGSTASHNYYTDAQAINAINNDVDHSSTASHSHTDLSNVSSDDHHTRYSDSESRNAVTSAALPGSIDMGGSNLNNVGTSSFSNSGNDFWFIEDGSGGTNTSPHTARFDDRDLRFWTGTGVGSVAVFSQNGDLSIPNVTVTIVGK